MMSKFIGGLSVVALVGFAWTAPASAAGGWGGSGFLGGVHGGGSSSGMHGGGSSGGMHGGGLSAGTQGGGLSGGAQGDGKVGGPRESFYRGPGPERPRDHDWGHDHDHDWDHDHHHHYDYDDDDGYVFLGDPYFYDDGGYAVDYAQAPADDGYWYYCADSKSYYPYVKACASQWERISLAIAFLLAGAVHWLGPGFVRRAYRRWDYPSQQYRVTGTLQLIAAALLAVPNTRLFGMGLAALITFGSVVILLKNEQYLWAIPGIAVLVTFQVWVMKLPPALVLPLG